MRIKNKILFYIIILISQIFLLSNNVNAEIINANTTISTDTTYDSLVIQNGATLTLDAVLTVTGNATIETGGILTHTVGGTTNFDLQVGGTLDIQAGSKIDVTGKGISTTGAGGSSGVGGGYGGYGYGGSKVPYGDIYNPIHVGSYGRTTGYPGGGLVRITTGNLINNGSILANGSNTSYGVGSGGSININVTGLLSGTGIYQTNGGTSSSGTHGGGGRVALKYGSITDLETLKANTSATGPGNAGEGTIYLKNNTSNLDLLMVKGDGVSANRYTGVGNALPDYYFDIIESTNYAKLYKIGTQNIVASSCITSTSGVIDPLIDCSGQAGFKYLDIYSILQSFDSIDRKYEYVIEGPDGGGSFIGSSTGTIIGNGTLSTKIKLVKLGSYKFTFNLYDGILEDSIIEGSAVKNVVVSDS